MAIAIVIAVVAVGVLSGYIRIGTATTYQKRAAIYWKSADIGIMDWDIRPSGSTSSLVFQNNKEYQIRINWVSSDGGSTTLSVGQTLLPGDTYKFTTSDSMFDCSSGASYSYEMVFEYDNLEHDILEKDFYGSERLTGSC